MDISGEIANIHMRTDAKNLVTTARTIHLPELQLIPIPMSDCEDDQPPQDGIQRQRSRSRDRENPHA